MGSLAVPAHVLRVVVQVVGDFVTSRGPLPTPPALVVVTHVATIVVHLHQMGWLEGARRRLLVVMVVVGLLPAGGRLARLAARLARLLLGRGAQPHVLVSRLLPVLAFGRASAERQHEVGVRVRHPDVVGGRVHEVGGTGRRTARPRLVARPDLIDLEALG